MSDFVALASFSCDGAFALYYLGAVAKLRFQTWAGRFLPPLFLAATLFLYPTGLVPTPNNIWARLLLRIALYVGYLFSGRSVSLGVAVYVSSLCAAIYFICQNVLITPLTKPLLMAELSLLPSVEANTALCALIVVGIKAACYLWICQIIPLHGIDDIRRPQVAVLATTVLASIFIKTVQKAISDSYGSVSRHPELTAYFVLLQAALLLCLVFFEQYQRKLRENTSYRLQVATAKALLEHLKAQQERDEEIRRLRHDLKNHMLALRHLIQKDRKQDAVRYINGFLEQAGHGELRPQTGHALLDCLISEKLTPAVKSGVETSVVLDFRQSCFLEDFDLCVIMGNALDNAVESCLKVPGDQPRFIEIRGGPSANQLIVHVINSCPNPVFHSGKLPITTKPNREYHGFGLGNIRRALEKYDGQLVISPQEEGHFSLCILIPLS